MNEVAISKVATAILLSTYIFIHISNFFVARRLHFVAGSPSLVNKCICWICLLGTHLETMPRA